MVLLSCTSSTKDTNINVALDLEILNPGGMHISLEKAPLVAMYYTLLAIYLVMCGTCTLMDSSRRLKFAFFPPSPSPSSVIDSLIIIDIIVFIIILSRNARCANTRRRR